jgi:hypothetical protein
VDTFEQITAAAVEAAGDISAYPDIESVRRLSQPIVDLQLAIVDYSPEVEIDLGELTVRELHQKYFNIAVAVGERDL